MARGPLVTDDGETRNGSVLVAGFSRTSSRRGRSGRKSRTAARACTRAWSSTPGASAGCSIDSRRPHETVEIALRRSCCLQIESVHRHSGESWSDKQNRTTSQIVGAVREPPLRNPATLHLLDCVGTNLCGCPLSKYRTGTEACPYGRRSGFFNSSDAGGMILHGGHFKESRR